MTENDVIEQCISEMSQDLSELEKSLEELEDYMARKSTIKDDTMAFPNYSNFFREKMTDFYEQVDTIADTSFCDVWHDAIANVKGVTELLEEKARVDLEQLPKEVVARERDRINDLETRSIQFLLDSNNPYQTPFCPDDIRVCLGEYDSYVEFPKLEKAFKTLDSNVDPFDGSIELFARVQHRDELKDWIEKTKKQVTDFKKCYDDVDEVMSDAYEFGVAFDDYYYQTELASFLGELLEKE